MGRGSPAVAAGGDLALAGCCGSWLWVARSGGTGWRGLEQASTPGSARLEFGKTNLDFLENRFVVIFRCTGDCIAVRHCAKYMVGPFCQLDFLFSVCDHCQSIVDPLSLHCYTPLSIMNFCHKLPYLMKTVMVRMRLSIEKGW